MLPICELPTGGTENQQENTNSTILVAVNNCQGVCACHPILLHAACFKSISDWVVCVSSWVLKKRDTNSLGNDISFNGVVALYNGWKTKHRNGKSTKKANNDSAPPQKKNTFHSDYVLKLHTTLKSTMMKGTPTLKQWFQIRGHPEIRNLMDRNWMRDDPSLKKDGFPFRI